MCRRRSFNMDIVENETEPISAVGINCEEIGEEVASFSLLNLAGGTDNQTLGALPTSPGFGPEAHWSNGLH